MVTNFYPTTFMNGLFTWYKDYNGFGSSSTLESMVNNSNCRQRWLDNKNKSFKIKVKPMVMDRAAGSIDQLPATRKWVTVSGGDASQPWLGVHSNWFGPQGLGLSVTLDNTGYLLYRYKYHIIFRQKRGGPFLT